MEDRFTCSFCGEPQETMYEGWFYTEAKLNPFAQGTASAGLMQRRCGCKLCVNSAIDAGLSQASRIPDESDSE